MPDGSRRPHPLGCRGCSRVDLAQVSAGVAWETSVYLFAHPEVNDYFTRVKGQPRRKQKWSAG